MESSGEIQSKKISQGRNEASVIDLTFSDDEENIDKGESDCIESTSNGSKARNAIHDTNSNGYPSKKRKTVICIDVDEEDETERKTDPGGSDSNPVSDHGGTLQNSEPVQVPPNAPLHIQIDQSDGVDFGTVSCNIHLPPSCPTSNVLTCSGTEIATGGQSSNSTTSTASTPTGTCTGALTHLQQRDKWSCGFRNMQMLLAAILPSIHNSHPFLHIHNTRTGTRTSNKEPISKRKPITIPSIRQIQMTMEQAWKQGYDPKGSQFFRSKIVGKKSKIGAVEASSVLSYWHVDSTVVQFIVCRESRQMLGDFVWMYFEVGCARANVNGSGTCSESCRRTRNYEICNAIGTRGLVDDLMSALDHDHDGQKLHPLPLQQSITGNGTVRSLESATRKISSAKQMDEVHVACHPPMQPLYLQWEGHSVTIVGIERTFTRRENHNVCSYNLLVFDPMKKFNGLEYVKGQWNGIQSMRLSTRTTMMKDCQVIVVSPNILCEEERERRRQDVDSGVVTAAIQKVMEAVHRNQSTL